MRYSIKLADTSESISGRIYTKKALETIVIYSKGKKYPIYNGTINPYDQSDKIGTANRLYIINDCLFADIDISKNINNQFINFAAWTITNSRIIDSAKLAYLFTSYKKAYDFNDFLKKIKGENKI